VGCSGATAGLLHEGMDETCSPSNETPEHANSERVLGVPACPSLPHFAAFCRLQELRYFHNYN